MSDGKYYWLKLKKDFFKRHDVKHIRRNIGIEGVMIYLTLLCESLDHNGTLRFSEEIPFTPSTLSSLIEMPQEYIEATMNLLQEIGLLVIQEDGTIVMTKALEMTGSETKWAEKKRTQRGQAEDNVQDSEDNVQNTEDNVRQSKSKSKSKSIEKDNNIYVQEFEELWELYPRKQGKTNALKSYIKARKEGVTKEEVEQGILNYGAYIKTNNVEGKFIKMGSTWFNQRCWTDDLSMRVKSGRLDWIDEVEEWEHL